MTVKSPGPLKAHTAIPRQALRSATAERADRNRNLLTADTRAAAYSQAPIDTFEPNKPNPFSKLLGSVDTSATRLPDYGARSDGNPVLPRGAHTPTRRESAKTWEERLLPARETSGGEEDHLVPGLDRLGRTTPSGNVVDGPGLDSGPNMQRSSMGAKLQRPLGDGVAQAVAMGAIGGAASAGVASAMSGGVAAPSIPAAAVAGGAITGGLRVLSNAWDEVTKWSEADAPSATPEPTTAKPTRPHHQSRTMGLRRPQASRATRLTPSTTHSPTRWSRRGRTRPSPRGGGGPSSIRTAVNPKPERRGAEILEWSARLASRSRS